MAQRAGVRDPTASGVRHAHGLKPHRVQSFKLSNDPQLMEKLGAVGGLYTRRRSCTDAVLRGEEQTQAPDRTQPGLPLKKGTTATMTHDYKRHGTTTLFAALNEWEETIIAQSKPKHCRGEWLDFQRLIGRGTPKGKSLHLIWGNHATHKRSNVHAWSGKHPRFRIHFTPTSASWLNMVERFFRSITVDRLRSGIFTAWPI